MSTTYILPFNESASIEFSSNIVPNEQHVLSQVNGINNFYNVMVPKFGPYLDGSLTVSHASGELVEEEDYILTGYHEQASLHLGVDVYTGITMLTQTLTGTFELTYTSVGGNLTDSLNADIQAETIKDALTLLKNPVLSPEALALWNSEIRIMAPSAHAHAVSGQDSVIHLMNELKGIKEAILAGPDNLSLDDIDGLEDHAINITEALNAIANALTGQMQFSNSLDFVEGKVDDLNDTVSTMSGGEGVTAGAGVVGEVTGIPKMFTMSHDKYAIKQHIVDKTFDIQSNGKGNTRAEAILSPTRMNTVFEKPYMMTHVQGVQFPHATKDNAQMPSAQLVLQDGRLLVAHSEYSFPYQNGNSNLVTDCIYVYEPMKRKRKDMAVDSRWDYQFDQSPVSWKDKPSAVYRLPTSHILHKYAPIDRGAYKHMVGGMVQTPTGDIYITRNHTQRNVVTAERLAATALVLFFTTQEFLERWNEFQYQNGQNATFAEFLTGEGFDPSYAIYADDSRVGELEVGEPEYFSMAEVVKLSGKPVYFSNSRREFPRIPDGYELNNDVELLKVPVDDTSTIYSSTVNTDNYADISPSILEDADFHCRQFLSIGFYDDRLLVLDRYIDYNAQGYEYAVKTVTNEPSIFEINLGAFSISYTETQNGDNIVDLTDIGSVMSTINAFNQLGTKIDVTGPNVVSEDIGHYNTIPSQQWVITGMTVLGSGGSRDAANNTTVETDGDYINQYVADTTHGTVVYKNPWLLLNVRIGIVDRGPTQVTKYTHTVLVSPWGTVESINGMDRYSELFPTESDISTGTQMDVVHYINGATQASLIPGTGSLLSTVTHDLASARNGKNIIALIGTVINLTAVGKIAVPGDIIEVNNGVGHEQQFTVSHVYNNDMIGTIEPWMLPKDDIVDPVVNNDFDSVSPTNCTVTRVQHTADILGRDQISGQVKWTPSYISALTADIYGAKNLLV